MNSGKSMQILAIAHNYEENGKKPLLFTSALDNRSGVGKISSRIGLDKDAIPIYKDTDIFEIAKSEKPDIVLVDEVSLLGKKSILQLVRIVNELEINVMCYGLKVDYRANLFEGSAYAFVHADIIEKISSTCSYCNNNAEYILKFKDGAAVYDGEQIEIGGNDLYKSVCRKHYYSGGK